uniref:cyclin-dependent kinase 12-like n=1 Tax=Myxine glutinosa TaxID=7769 RepID=UPI00358F4A8B
MPLSGGKKNQKIKNPALIGDWKIISTIGKDTRRNIYKAMDMTSAEQVVLKKAKCVEEKDYLLEEAQMMRRLHHPNIVTVIGIHEGDISKEVVGNRYGEFY